MQFQNLIRALTLAHFSWLQNNLTRVLNPKKYKLNIYAKFFQPFSVLYSALYRRTAPYSSDNFCWIFCRSHRVCNGLGITDFSLVFHIELAFNDNFYSTLQGICTQNVAFHKRIQMEKSSNCICCIT
jgi:hypothetical protein